MPLSYPSHFDPNARCDFHAGALGYSCKDCKALKNKVQDLIESKVISFMPHGLHINVNPLPSHTGPSIHAMEEVIENGSEDDYHTSLNEHDDLKL